MQQVKPSEKDEAFKTVCFKSLKALFSVEADKPGLLSQIVYRLFPTTLAGSQAQKENEGSHNMLRFFQAFPARREFPFLKRSGNKGHTNFSTIRPLYTECSKGFSPV